MVLTERCSGFSHSAFKNGAANRMIVCTSWLLCWGTTDHSSTDCFGFFYFLQHLFTLLDQLGRRHKRCVPHLLSSYFAGMKHRSQCAYIRVCVCVCVCVCFGVLSKQRTQFSFRAAGHTIVQLVESTQRSIICFGPWHIIAHTRLTQMKRVCFRCRAWHTSTRRRPSTTVTKRHKDINQSKGLLTRYA